MKWIYPITALLGALAVIIGAFGAHGLKPKLTPEQLQTFETGVKYQFYHVFALLVVGLFYLKTPSGTLQTSACFFIAGILFFSGSVYLLACKDIFGIQNWTKILGPVTPLGGLCFIIGWSCLFWYFLKVKFI